MEKLVTTKEIVKIKQIHPNPWNPNKMSDFIYQRMKDTIERKGLFGAIIVRPYGGEYQILDGEHRLKACTELGYVDLPVEVSPEMTDEEAKFWTIYFNNTRGKDDIEKRVAITQSLSEGQTQLLPFTEDEIRHEKELFAFDFSKYDEQREIKKREISRTVMIGLTEEEWAVWEKALQVAHTEKRNDLQLFLYMLNDYLCLRIKMADIPVVPEKVKEEF